MEQSREQTVRSTAEEISLLDLFHTLWLRRRLFASTALFIMAVGFIVLFQLVPQYTATSSLMLGGPETHVVDIEEVLTNGLGDSAAKWSQVEVLRSSGLARKLIEKLGLLSVEEFNPALGERSSGNGFKLSQLIPSTEWLPSEWLEAMGVEPEAEVTDEQRERKEMATATDIFLDKLEVELVRLSNVVEISFESRDPKLAEEVANQLPETYIVGQMEAKLEAAERATKWLDEKLASLKVKVENSERAVELYREQHGLTEVKGARILSSQLSEVNSQLIVARAERAQAEARLRQLNELKRRSANLASASEVQASTLIQSLKEQEATIARKVSELSVEYGKKHPRMQQALAELSDIRAKINSETNQIVATIENEVEVARTKEQSLTKSLKDLEKQSAQQTKESIELNALQREAEANRTLYETFLNRFKETSSTVDITEPDARVISKAEEPSAPSFPNKVMMTIGILVAGLFGAVTLVFFVEFLNPGITSPEQIESLLGFSAIAMIPAVSGKSPEDYLLDKPHSSYGEALNSLKTSLMLSSPDEPIKVIQITSSVPKEGKTTLALSFARLMASSGKKVILIDGDLRRASIQKRLGITATGPGLTDLVMTSDKPVEEFVLKDEKSGVLVMAKGEAKYVNATDLLSSHRMQAIIQTLKEAFDYVIVDSPPVMAVADARIIAKIVDKTVFVVFWDKTPRKVIEAALKQLAEGGADIAGCVLQQVKLKRYGAYGSASSGYYYHYGRYGDYYTN